MPGQNLLWRHRYCRPGTWLTPTGIAAPPEQPGRPLDQERDWMTVAGCWRRWARFAAVDCSFAAAGPALAASQRQVLWQLKVAELREVREQSVSSASGTHSPP